MAKRKKGESNRTPEPHSARRNFKDEILRSMGVLDWDLKTLAERTGLRPNTLQNHINLRGKGFVRASTVFTICQALLLPPIETAEKCGFSLDLVEEVRNLTEVLLEKHTTALDRVNNLITEGYGYLLRGAPEMAKRRFRQAKESLIRFEKAGWVRDDTAPIEYAASIGLLDAISRTGRDIREAIALTDSLLSLCAEHVNWRMAEGYADAEEGDSEAKVWGWRADIRGWEKDFRNAFIAIQRAHKYVKTDLVKAEIFRTHLHLVRETEYEDTLVVLGEATELWESLPADTHEWVCLGQACAITWAAFDLEMGLSIMKQVIKGYEEHWTDKLLRDHLLEATTNIRYARLLVLVPDVDSQRLAYAKAKYGWSLAQGRYPHLAAEAKKVMDGLMEPGVA